MGAQGTALAVQSADIILTSDNIARLPQAVRISRAVRAVVQQNIVLAITIKLGMAVVSIIGDGALSLAVASDAVSLLLVLANGIRLRWVAKAIYSQ
jgi:Zn2+/Cd2+-exporting ATPase